jgi:hypothetical protein
MMAIFFVIAVVWATGLFFQSEEKKVKEQFRNLAEWVSKEPGENTFTMVHKVKNIETLFAERCRLKTPVETLTGQYTPEEISNYTTLCRSQFIKIDLIFYDLNVEFPEKGLAKVILTARLTGTLTTGEYVDEALELQCVFMKIRKKWLFSDFEAVEVLKK